MNEYVTSITVNLLFKKNYPTTNLPYFVGEALTLLHMCLSNFLTSLQPTLKVTLLNGVVSKGDRNHLGEISLTMRATSFTLFPKFS